MKKKLKRIIAGVMAVFLCFGMTGCGSEKKTDNANIEDSVNSMSEKIESAISDNNTVNDSENSEEVSESTVEDAYEPSEEIINAELSSGLIQIGNDIFRNGGYITVNDFISEYGDNFDTSSIDTEKVADEDWRFTYFISRKDNGGEVDLVCKAPVSGNGTVGDAVVISLNPSGNYENVWYPSGICGADAGTKDDIIAYYEKQSLMPTELPYSNTPVDERFSAADNDGKYSIIDGDSYSIVIAATTLDSPNLYGITPKIQCMYSSFYDGNYFKYSSIYYKDGEEELIR